MTDHLKSACELLNDMAIFANRLRKEGPADPEAYRCQLRRLQASASALYTLLDHEDDIVDTHRPHSATHSEDGTLLYYVPARVVAETAVEE